MNKFIFLYKSLFLLILVASSSCLFAQEKNAIPTINILTWWGYLKHPEIIKAAEKECRVNISFDEYYSNDEFLRRWGEHKEFYNIIIFSDPIYNVIKDRLPKIMHNDLFKQSLTYNSVIKKHYQEKKYPHNVVYFFQALTGFVWNPANITLNNTDTVTSIFNKAGKKYVVIIDDPVEAWKLIEAHLKEHSKTVSFNDLTIENFKKTIQHTHAYIANNYSQIYKNPGFAFSFNWSGVSIIDITKSNKDYPFLIHPKFSSVTSDLLAQTSNDKKSYCVAKFLTSQKTLAFLQNKNFYFSPYTQYANIENKIFKRIYKNYTALLPSLSWADSIKKNDFEKLNESWQIIKISLNNRLIK